MGERRGAYRALVGKPEGRRPLGRPRRRWEDNIKMDLLEGGWEHGLGLSVLGQGQVVGSCELGNGPSGFMKCAELPDEMITRYLLRKDSARGTRINVI
jgi:hypothetical protein